jgi:hypothetical protein
VRQERRSVRRVRASEARESRSGGEKAWGEQIAAVMSAKRAEMRALRIRRVITVALRSERGVEGEGEGEIMEAKTACQAG